MAPQGVIIPSFAEALADNSSQEVVHGTVKDLHFTKSLKLDMDKIIINPPSCSKPYPSVSLKPDFRASLGMKWQNSIILKVLV